MHADKDCLFLGLADNMVNRRFHSYHNIVWAFPPLRSLKRYFPIAIVSTCNDSTDPRQVWSYIPPYYPNWSHSTPPALPWESPGREIVEQFLWYVLVSKCKFYQKEHPYNDQKKARACARPRGFKLLSTPLPWTMFWRLKSVCPWRTMYIFLLFNFRLFWAQK